MDTIEMLAKSCELSARQVDAANGQPAAATPCTDWDSKELVNHLVATMQVATALINELQPEFDPTNPPTVVGGDPAADYRQAANAMLEGFRAPGAMEKTVQGPAGPQPGAEFINFPLLDVFVHSWDLSQATGLDGEYPDEIVEYLTGVTAMAFADERPPPIGPAVAAPANATAMETLVSFLGRTVTPT